MASSSTPADANGGPPPAPPPEDSAGGAEGLAELQVQLREAQGTIEAIRAGGADLLVIGPPGHEQIYAITSADRTYRLIVQAMNEGAVTVSPGGVILDVNPCLGTMTGRPAEGLVGSGVLNLIADVHRPAFSRLLDVGVGGSARGEVGLKGPDGTIVPVQVAVSGFDLDGLVLRCVVLTDLTAQHNADAEIRDLNAMLVANVEQHLADLERTSKNLESFTYSVSHDLRAPLRGLNGYSQVLMEEYGDILGETGRGYAMRIQAASERLATLMDGLLMLSRVARAEMHTGPVDVSAEVTAIAGQLQSGDPGRQADFVIQKGVIMHADRNLVRAVLQDLLDNAWKFTALRDRACIEFGTATDGAAGTYCFVRDNGDGFDPAYAAKLFRPFQRLHAAGEFPGDGIGLAHAERVIERLGGRIWAEGMVGSGATFSFTLESADGP